MVERHGRKHECPYEVGRARTYQAELTKELQREERGKDGGYWRMGYLKMETKSGEHLWNLHARGIVPQGRPMYIIGPFFDF